MEISIQKDRKNKMKLDVQTYVEKDQSNLKISSVGPSKNPQNW